MYNYLGISLQRLLQVDKLRRARVLAGKRGMNKRITKVDVMEVPDIIEWVGEGELLITTAYSIKDNIDVLMKLIPELNEKGVAALGIKIGRYIKKLPPDIIALDFVKKLSISKMEGRYKLEIFDELLSSNENRQNKAIERAKTFHFNLYEKYGVAQ
ncbi:PucR family transcriptional regulator ligand-binding domain-containing protein [Clostridium sp. Mt-5]|uniref:PucR family transcriptional regulator ligand-binding domain-containing protein n=1 Tax=Clostridium moutaii TaxID=3240932 RepID=A0ABV4BRC9_9CLOT